jgi:hypothetical protein
MGGGLMQLVAYGAQDIYLTGNPQITFFKVVYRRHTNFAMEHVEQTLNGSVSASGRSTCTISRNGDLVEGVFVKHTGITGDGNATLNESATQLASVTCEIGGQQVDKHYGHWLQVWAELTENKTGRTFGTNYQKTTGLGAGVICNDAIATADGGGVGATSTFFNAADMDGRVVYTPLQFWFCRNPGLALPLIALQYHEVKLIFEWGATMGATDHTVWCNYVYLDTDERRRFAQVSHEYLIEQVQFQDQAEATTHTLTFNHPVKELIWTGGWAGGAVVALNALTDTAQIKLNGHDRMASMPMSYFSGYQVWKHHSGEGGFVDNSIACYSFALKPEEHQPSGTCNFSRIDNAQLTLSAADAVYIYAVNYNVLRIMSGMGGLAYSN